MPDQFVTVLKSFGPVILSHVVSFSLDIERETPITSRPLFNGFVAEKVADPGHFMGLEVIGTKASEKERLAVKMVRKNTLFMI